MNHIKELIATPAQSKSDWFLGNVSNSFEQNTPSYITIAAGLCAIGCFHNWWIQQSAHDNGSAKTTHRLTRAYSGAVQSIIAILSFMTVLDHPHLQQIVSTFAIIAFNCAQFVPSIFRFVSSKINGGKFMTKSSSRDQINTKKGHGGGGGNVDDDEFKSNRHDKQKSNKQSETLTEPSSPAPAGKNKNNHNANELSMAVRLILTWCKTAILSYGAVLPTIIANNSHISHSKSSVFNPFSWFSSSDNYSIFNPFSLSLVNMIGVGLCIFATLMYTKESFRKSATDSKFIPQWYNSMFNYFVFAVGLCLSSISFTRPLTWLTTATPLGAFVLTLIKWCYDYQHSNAPVPSLLKQFKDDTWVKDAVHNGKKFLPCVAV